MQVPAGATVVLDGAVHRTSLFLGVTTPLGSVNEGADLVASALEHELGVHVVDAINHEHCVVASAERATCLLKTTEIATHDHLGLGQLQGIWTKHFQNKKKDIPVSFVCLRAISCTVGRAELANVIGAP